MPARDIVTLIIGVALLCSWPMAATALSETPASQLRVTLDRLLSEHAFLTVQAMHAGVSDDDVFVAAADALEDNTVELEDAVTGIYGETAGRRFGDLWRAHIAYIVDYTRAHRADDEEAKQQAEEGIRVFQAEFAAFLTGANPELSEEAVRSLLEDHVSQLEQVAHLQAGDYEAAYEAVRHAHRHMFAFGDGLSQAIGMQFPELFTGRSFAFGPAMDLRIALDQLLGEHAFLAAEVMRMAETGSDAQTAAAGALAANGDALRSTVAEIYDSDAAARFADVWERHNGLYVDYVRAVHSGNDAGASRARSGLEAFGDEVADFFVVAADLPDGDAVRAGLRSHTHHLIEQVDAYASGDYPTAFAVAREAYRHMGAISDVLATGIANQQPERFLPDTAVPSEERVPLLGWGERAVLVAIVTVIFGVYVHRSLPTGARNRPKRAS